MALPLPTVTKFKTVACILWVKSLVLAYFICSTNGTRSAHGRETYSKTESAAHNFPGDQCQFSLINRR